MNNFEIPKIKKEDLENLDINNEVISNISEEVLENLYNKSGNSGVIHEAKKFSQTASGKKIINNIDKKNMNEELKKKYYNMTRENKGFLFRKTRENEEESLFRKTRENNQEFLF